jgi:integrase
VERPRKRPFVGSFYEVEELNRLLPLIAEPHMKLAVSLAAFYGLRRSEIIGLRWDATNFEKKTITICRTAQEYVLNGKTYRS